MKESGNTLSQATKDRILRAVAVMQATVKTAKIQKLAQSTNLRDLSPDLLAWLGTTKDAEWQRGGTGRLETLSERTMTECHRLTERRGHEILRGVRQPHDVVVTAI